MLPREPNKVFQKANRLMLFLTISFVLSVFFVSGADWHQYRGFYNNRGLVALPQSHFEPNNFSIKTMPYGMNYQPLILPIQPNSDTNYLIIFNGNFLQAYDSELILKYEYSIGSPVLSQPTNYAYNNKTYIAGIFGGLFKSFWFNGSQFFPGYNNGTGFNSTCDLPSGVQCKNTICSFFCDSSTTSLNRNYRVNVATNSTKSIAVSGTIFTQKYTPALESVSYGTIAVYSCDVDGDGNGGFCIFNLSDNNFGKGFFKDDIVSQNRMGSPTLYNIDGVGDTEILFASANSAGTSSSCIGSYKLDGTLNWQRCQPKASCNFGYSGATIVLNANTGTCEYNGLGSFCSTSTCASKTDVLSCTAVKNAFGFGSCCEWKPAQPYVCGNSNSANTECYFCVDYIGRSVGNASFTHASESATPVPYHLGSGISGYFHEPNFNNKMNFIGERYVMYGDKLNDILLNLSAYLDSSYALSYGSLTNDGEGQIVASKSGETKVFFSSYFQQLPVLVKNVRYNYRFPICSGTSLKFWFDENQGDYTEQNSIATERIVTNCGVNSSLNYGSWNLSRPGITCYYPEISGSASYNARIYLQNEFYPNDFSVYQDITVTQLNGTTGLSCNIACGISGCGGETISTVPDSISDSETGNAVKGLFDVFTYGNAWLKWTFVLAVIIATVVFLALKGISSPLVINGIVFLELLVFAILSLVSWAIIFLYCLVAIAITALLFVLGSGSSQNGG